MLSCNFSKYQSRQIKSEESMAVTMRGFFYLLQACQPNIAAMRGGIVVLTDGRHMGFRNFNLQVEERAAALYAHSHPLRRQQIFMMNTSIIVHAFYNIVKMFMSFKLVQRHVFCGDMPTFLDSSPYSKDVLPQEWNCIMDHDDLDRAFQEMLHERYELAAKFRL